MMGLAKKSKKKIAFLNASCPSPFFAGLAP
jgi:hypothetical protein